MVGFYINDNWTYNEVCVDQFKCLILVNNLRPSLPTLSVTMGAIIPIHLGQ